MNKTIKIILLVAGMGIISSLFFGQNPEQQEAVRQMIDDGALLIDTRSPAEYAGGHFEGAVNLPYDVIGRSIENVAQSKDKPIVVYCHSGARSSHARKTLLNLGYTQVVNGGSLRNMHKTLEN